MTPDVGEGISIENLSEEEPEKCYFWCWRLTAPRSNWKTLHHQKPRKLDDGRFGHPALTGWFGMRSAAIEQNEMRYWSGRDPNASYYVWLQPNGATSPKTSLYAGNE